MNLTIWEDFERGFIVGQVNQDPNDWTPWSAERRDRMRRKMRQIEVRNALVLMHQWMTEAEVEGLACGRQELWIEIRPHSISMQELYGKGSNRGGLVLTWDDTSWTWDVQGSWQEHESPIEWVWGWLVNETGPRDR